MNRDTQKVLISVKDLTFKYGKSTIFEKVNFNIYKNKNIAILGKNGGGKSTLIKVILGFLKKETGSITFNLKRNKIGYLPQLREFDSNFPINIFDLVISGITNKKNLFRKFDKEEITMANNLIKHFEISHLKNKLIGEVSGGQLQRALIARALISSPEILFLDEPESFLDKEFGTQLYEKIRELSDSTLIIISHDLDRFCDFVDSIFIVEGNLKVYESKNEFFNSEDAFRHVQHIHKHKH